MFRMERDEIPAMFEVRDILYKCAEAVLVCPNNSSVTFPDSDDGDNETPEGLGRLAQLNLSGRRRLLTRLLQSEATSRHLLTPEEDVRGMP